MVKTVDKIQEPEHMFWKAGRDCNGSESSPIHLLVLCSLRILTRNLTLDELQEDTFLSAKDFLFLQEFMKW